MVRRRRAVLGGFGAAVAISLSGVAAADPGQGGGNGVAPLLHGMAHCVKGTPGTNSGVVGVHTSAKRNDTRVHVTLLRGMPNSTYYVAIACQRFIGSLKTNRHGNGTANIDAPGAASFPFYVDLGVGNGSQAGTADYRIAGPFTGSSGRGGHGNGMERETGPGTGIERPGPEAAADRL
jgi:hypothetical protein